MMALWGLGKAQSLPHHCDQGSLIYECSVPEIARRARPCLQGESKRRGLGQVRFEKSLLNSENPAGELSRAL